MTEFKENKCKHCEFVFYTNEFYTCSKFYCPQCDTLNNKPIIKENFHFEEIKGILNSKGFNPNKRYVSEFEVYEIIIKPALIKEFERIHKGD